MFCTMRFITAFVLFFFVFGPFCVAAPAVAADIIRRSESVLVQRPARVQNVPIARLGVPFMFQLDPNTFTVVDSDSGAPMSTQIVVTLDRDSNVPRWISFNPDNYIFSGTPDAVSDTPFRVRLVATAPGSGDQNDTAFDLYVSDTPPTYLVNTLEHQQNAEFMHLTNASYLTKSVGVWIRPGAPFEVQMQPFCNRSSNNPPLYYTAYYPSNFSMDPLPDWLRFDNDSLSLSGTAPDESTSTDIMLRCSSVLGAGGPEQRITLEVAEHVLEFDGAPFSFQFAPGYVFTYNFEWLWSQLYLDGKSISRLDSMRFFNSSNWDPQLGASEKEVGISFSLDAYPWLSFNNINQTISGTPPIVQTLPREYPSVPLNISCRGREIVTEIPVYSLAASAWHPYREISSAIVPGFPYSHNFTVDLLESVASNPKWDVFIHIDDPINSTAWLTFNTTTNVLHGTAPPDSPPRDIPILLTSNAWGFNTSIPYTLTINSYSPTPATGNGWTATAVALSIALAIALVLLALSIFVFCGLRKGWLVSPSVLIAYHRKVRHSNQTLVGSNSDFGISCCKGAGVEKPDGSDDIRIHVERDIETQMPVPEVHRERSVPAAEPTQEYTAEAMETPAPRHSTNPSPTSATAAVTATTPTDATSFLTAPTTSQTKSITSTGTSNPPAKSLKKSLNIFNKGSNRNKKNKKPATVSPIVESKNPPFIPMWKGHVYQTPELLQAEERAWQARRLERKARLKREYFARKRAQAQGTYTDTRFPPKEEEDKSLKPNAPRRFGIFEQLAIMEDLDRRGPANMRGGSMPRSRLVEVGENRFFDDTMLDRSEVGSSEFSSLASWETLSESSLPDMVLCYGQLGRRKQREGVAPRGPRTAVDPWAAKFADQQEELGLPGPVEDTLTDENLLDRIARSLGPENALDDAASNSSSHEGEVHGIRKKSTSGAIVYSPVKWKGKAVARGEHGSLTTSQHSPTFKMLARQRFQASMDNTFGSPLSRMAVARTLAHTSPSHSVGSMASRSGTNLSSSGSMASVVFHIGEKGVQFYFIPASTKFCFTARVTKTDADQQEKRPTFGRAKAAVYGIQMEDSHEVFMPLWLHFNAPSLEFWGQAPDTMECLQYSMRIVHRSTGEVVGRLTVIAAQPDELSDVQATLGFPAKVPKTLEAISTSSPNLATTLHSPYSPKVFRTLPQSPRSIATSQTGTELSSLGSMTSVVFHLDQDGVHIFVIPAASKFCFKAPIAKADGESAPIRSTFGRAVASPYVIQLEECDVISIPLWLHFVPQSMEFWGEAPSVNERLHVAMRIVHRETGQVVGHIIIIVADLDDAARLQTELGEPHTMNERLSVVEEVSSIDSDEGRADPQVVAPVGPQTPKRSRNALMATSSSRGLGSWRGGRSPASRRSLTTPPSRRSLGTPRSKSGQRLRMKAPPSGRLTAYDDYDSMMFEGHSYGSESMCGPELSTLTGHGAGTIANGALDAMSRAASREGSVRLSLCDKTLVVIPTIMNGVEYFVIRRGADFRFVLKVPTISAASGNRLKYDVLVEEQQREGWRFPEWIHGEVNEETGAIELSGSTRDVDEHEEHTLIVYGEGGEEVKRVQVVVAPDVRV